MVVLGLKSSFQKRKKKNNDYFCEEEKCRPMQMCDSLMCLLIIFEQLWSSTAQTNKKIVFLWDLLTITKHRKSAALSIKHFLT